MKGVKTKAAPVAWMVPFLFFGVFLRVFFVGLFFLLFFFLGQVVKHGAVKCVLNEGMPIYRRPYEKGRLIVEFRVSGSTYFHGAVQH